jgi:lipopolysaccharide biosynthesis regulator YciM
MAATDQRKAATANAPKIPKEAIVKHEKVQIAVEAQHMPVRQKRSNPAVDLENYNFRLAVDSWDQIGSLASEVATSVLAQLAEGMADQMRQDTRSAKRRKVVISPNQFDPEPTLVSSDDDSYDAEEPISRTLTNKIDRVARMSKYMLQVEHYHRLLRNEMMALSDPDEDLE